MLISEKFGALPALSFVWNHDALGAACIMFAADFGMGMLLMCLEGVPPWRRTMYKAFLWGDSVFLPLAIASETTVLAYAPPLQGFYTSLWWHLSLLSIGISISVLMEVGGVRGGQYTIGQEFSPAKIWHTCVFGFVFYWLSSALIPVVVVHAPASGIAFLVVAIVGYVVANAFDWRLVHRAYGTSAKGCISRALTSHGIGDCSNGVTLDLRPLDCRAVLFYAGLRRIDWNTIERTILKWKRIS